MIVTLREFLENFVCPNTLIRLWEPYDGGHRMIGVYSSDNDENVSRTDSTIAIGNRETAMEWQILSGAIAQSKYLNYPVKGVTDIICEHNMEAVNIVIMTDPVPDINKHIDLVMKRNASYYSSRNQKEISGETDN